MTKVYGYSDDIIVIEGETADEIDCYNEEVTIWFADGTVIKAGYPKKDMGIWWIRVEEEGTAEQHLKECFDEDADVYSDVFKIDSEMINYCVGPVIEDVQTLKGLFRELKKNYALPYISMAYKEIMEKEL